MKVLKIEFGENEKAQNKKLSLHVRQSTETQETVLGISQDVAKFFDSERCRFYGENWLNLLFPYLNY